MLETGKALNICDGPNESHNPIGCMLRDQQEKAHKESRSWQTAHHHHQEASGIIYLPCKEGVECIPHLAWDPNNFSNDLREVKTLSGAKKMPR